MKIYLQYLAILFGILFPISLDAQNKMSSGRNFLSKDHQETKIRISFNNDEVIVTCFDNATTRDFLSLLPLSVTFEDYAKSEKITYLPRKLMTQTEQQNRDIRGEFAYYAPWGNIALFYKGYSNASGLYILGRIESGKEKLAQISHDFTARIEIIEK